MWTKVGMMEIGTESVVKRIHEHVMMMMSKHNYWLFLLLSFYFRFFLNVEMTEETLAYIDSGQSAFAHVQ